MQGLQGGRGYDRDILLKSTIMANELLFCFLCLILRLSELRVSMTNAIGVRECIFLGMQKIFAKFDLVFPK